MVSMVEQQSSGMQTAEEMAADRYRVKRTGLGWWRVAVGDGKQTVGRCFTRAEAERLASSLRAAFLDGAYVVAELNDYRRAMRELGQLVREQSRSRITPAPHA
jgi:hypothetical protein